MCFLFSDTVANIVGSNVKIQYDVKVKIELKGEKLENRLLAFSAYRMYMFTVKNSIKLENSFSLVDIYLIESQQEHRLCLAFQNESRPYTFHSMDISCTQDINNTICYLIESLKNLFPQTPIEFFIKKFDVHPRSRFDTLIEYLNDIEEKMRFRLVDFPCGGFSNQYACFCDYYAVPYREEVAWDIDTIYAAHNNTELSILDFEHLDLKDLVPIVAALAYNGWFTKFRVSNVKIVNSSHSGSDQLCEQIIHMLRKSNTLEEIYLDNTGIRYDFVNKMFSAMLINTQTAIRVIDISNNQIEDKGLKSMTAFVAKSFHMAASVFNASTDDLSSSLSSNSGYIQQSLPAAMINGAVITPASTSSAAKLMYRGLSHLNLSRCSITSKGLSELSEALYLNKTMFNTLTYLNLSDNIFKEDITVSL